MNRQGFFFFYPLRIVKVGTLILAAGCSLAILLLYFADPPLTRSAFLKNEEHNSLAPIHISLGLGSQGPLLKIPDLSAEMVFFSDPNRPGQVVENRHFFVSLLRSSEVKRVTLPCRLNLEVKKDKIVFAQDKSDFWVEVLENKDEQIEVNGYITSLENEKIYAGMFVFKLKEPLLRSGSEFKDLSPFRVLAGAQWWGRDLVKEQFEATTGVERVYLDSSFLDITENDWLIWKEGGWKKSLEIESDCPLARIQTSLGKTLVLEGWDENGYVRIALNGGPISNHRPKGEDLLSSIRVRSEKQISCILEKQCMVLKTGDWILKSGGRWKVLRQAQDRDAFLSGQLSGDLFVFEQILPRQGQKMIQGSLFHPGRTQVANIEVMAQPMRKAAGRKSQKGKS